MRLPVRHSWRVDGEEIQQHGERSQGRFSRHLSSFTFVQCLLRTDQRNAAARYDAFFDRSTCCVQRVFNPSLFLFHLGLGCSADADHSDSARELCQTLLELLPIVVGCSLLVLTPNLTDATLDVLSRTAISSSIALRQSPKPGALIAAACTVPRSLLTTGVCERFAFDIFSNDQEWTAGFGTCSSTGSRS
jgi:hypothetical protein